MKKAMMILTVTALLSLMGSAAAVFAEDTAVPAAGPVETVVTEPTEVSSVEVIVDENDQVIDIVPLDEFGNPILGDIVEGTEEEEIPVVVVYQNAAQERIALALQYGITPGKMNLIQKLAASAGALAPVDPSVIVEAPAPFAITDWTGATVQEIMAAIKINRKALAPADETPDADEPEVTETPDPEETAAVTTSETSKKAHGKSGNKGGKKK